MVEKITGSERDNVPPMLYDGLKKVGLVTEGKTGIKTACAINDFVSGRGIFETTRNSLKLERQDIVAGGDLTIIFRKDRVSVFFKSDVDSLDFNSNGGMVSAIDLKNDHKHLFIVFKDGSMVRIGRDSGRIAMETCRK